MIKLKEAVLIRFGKFKNTSFKFDDGLQIFYGENEAGKSTIQTFIKTMLYDIPSRKKAGEVVKDREKIIPHGEKTAEGILRIIADGREIEIHKIIGRTSSYDKNEVLDGVTGELLDGYPSVNIGEILFGVSQSVFEKTFWLSQMGAAFSGKDDEIAKHLINLQNTGDEDVSAEKTMDELEKISRFIKARKKSQNRGEIDILLEKREEKVRERFQLLEQGEQRKVQQQRLNAEKIQRENAIKKEKKLEELLERQSKLYGMESRLKKWQQIEKLDKRRSEILNNSEYIKYNKITDDEILSAESLEEKIKILDRKDNIEYDNIDIGKNIKQNQAKIRLLRNLTFAGIGIIILSLVIASVRISYWGIISGISGTVGLICSVLGGICFKKSKEEGEQLKGKFFVLEEEKNNIKAEFDGIKNKLSEILSLYNCSSVEELRVKRNFCIKTETEAKGLESAYDSLVDGEDIDVLKRDAKELETLIAESVGVLERDIKGELEETRKIRMDAEKNIGDIEGKLAYVFAGIGNPADCETEIIGIDAEIAELEKKLRAVQLATEVFSSVYEKKRLDFAPRVNEKVNEYLDILTMGRYNETRVSEEYRLRLKDSSEAEYLSFGTYEQIYFALRLALAELIGNGDEPMFLDDFMTAYDDRRSSLAIEILKNISVKRQILLFTCHGRDAQKATQMGAVVNYLEEETENGC